MNDSNSLNDYFCPLQTSFTPVRDVFFQRKVDNDFQLLSSNLAHNKVCHNMNFETKQDIVSLVNVTQLLTQLSSHSAGACVVVLFYATWCPFSMRLSPIYNALGRVIPGIPLYAVEVVRQVNTLASNQLR